jgi:hypothetical protein
MRNPSIALVFASLLVLVQSSAVRAQCPPITTLSNGVAVSVTTDPQVFGYTPASLRWSAVGVRPGDAQDWNLVGLDITTSPPGCFHGGLGTSNGTGIDFLVTDWHFRSAQDDYARVLTTGNVGTAARAEFHQATNEFFANHVYEQVPVASGDVLKVRETHMEAGVQYFIEFWPSPTLTGCKFYLFEPITSGTGCAPKSAAVIQSGPLVTGGGNGFNFTPTVTGQYGIVVTNESATSGDFQWVVKHCPFDAGILSDNVPYYSNLVEDYPGFTPTAQAWSFVGVRGESGFFYGLDVCPWFRYQNWFNMLCSDSIIGSQYSGLGVKLIAEDFRSSPLRHYQTRMAVQGQPQTFCEGYLEWEDGTDSLVVNAAPTSVNPGPHNVFDSWNVRLVKDGLYTFHLVPQAGGTANYTMVLFGNFMPWPARPNALFDNPGPIQYTAIDTDLYGLAVVNDNGGTGGYSIQVTSSLVGVDPGGSSAPATSRIRSVAPNPSFAGTRVEYEIARAGEVSLYVTDVAGRVIANVQGARQEAGTGSLAWDGRTASGARPPAGVYFVTLAVDAQATDRAKMIVLR